MGSTNLELVRAIENHGLKYTFLAEKLGIERTKFSRYLHGHVPIPDGIMRDLALVLGKKVEELFPSRRDK